jgi:hypothetical protein
MPTYQEKNISKTLTSNAWEQDWSRQDSAEKGYIVDRYCRLLMRLSWVTRTPFGVPVLPEVNTA